MIYEPRYAMNAHEHLLGTEAERPGAQISIRVRFFPKESNSLTKKH